MYRVHHFKAQVKYSVWPGRIVTVHASSPLVLHLTSTSTKSCCYTEKSYYIFIPSILDLTLNLAKVSQLLLTQLGSLLSILQLVHFASP